MDDQAQEDFRAYVDARSGPLLRTAYLLTGNCADAEDLLQSTLAKTYLAWHRIQRREALDGYVRRVMVNTQTSAWRRRRVTEHPTDDLPDVAAAGDHTEDVTLHDALWTAMQGLPRRQRAVVVLRYYEDLSEAETAGVLGASIVLTFPLAKGTTALPIALAESEGTDRLIVVAAPDSRETRYAPDGTTFAPMTSPAPGVATASVPNDLHQPAQDDPAVVSCGSSGCRTRAGATSSS